MSYKILILIATLYVVKASVITLNANEAEESPLTDGTINNDAAEVEQAFDEDSVLENIDLVSDLTDLYKLPRCRARFCNRACRLLRFDNGTCVDGLCKCSGKAKDTSIFDDTFNNEDKEDEEIFDTVEGNVLENEDHFMGYTELFKTPRCRARNCNHACRLLRFENGTCVNGRCQCSRKAKETTFFDDTFNDENGDDEQTFKTIDENFMENEDLFMDYTELFKTPRCRARLCNRACRLLRFENGTCVNDRCQCSGKVNNIEKAGLITDPADISKIPRCNARLCNRACRLLRFDNGTCVNGQCKCSGKGVLTGAGTPNEKFTREDLFSTANREDNVMDLTGTDSNLYDSSKKLKCIPRICDRLCRLLRFDNGTCVNGRCKCAKKDSTTTEKTVDI